MNWNSGQQSTLRKFQFLLTCLLTSVSFILNFSFADSSRIPWIVNSTIFIIKNFKSVSLKIRIFDFHTQRQITNLIKSNFQEWETNEILVRFGETTLNLQSVFIYYYLRLIFYVQKYHKKRKKTTYFELIHSLLFFIILVTIPN